MNEHISLLVMCKLSLRDTVGAMIGQICDRLEKAGEPEGFKYQVTSAFNEAFNNHAKHGGPELREKEILINVTVTDTQLIIEFQDDGKTFELGGTAKPELSQLRESGMGLFIMRAFMSELYYESGDDRKANVLRLVRNLTGSKKDASKAQ